MQTEMLKKDVTIIDGTYVSRAQVLHRDQHKQKVYVAMKLLRDTIKAHGAGARVMDGIGQYLYIVAEYGGKVS
jgi:hypothetical protein